MKKTDENLGIMAEVASLYFEQGLSQQEIADRLYYSRSKVSRLISKAIKENVVEITINYPIERLKNLELNLIKVFSLDEAIVIRDYDTSKDIMMKRIGNAAAEYLDSVLELHSKLGVTWGTTVYHTIKELKPKEKKDLHVFQLMGASENIHNSSYNSGELNYRVIEKYGGKISQLFSPLVVENDLIRDSLMRESIIRKVIEDAKKVDIVITGIGEFQHSITKAWENLDSKRKKQLIDKGAVGVLLAHIIKENGELVDPSLDKTVIGISLEDLRNIKNVVAVATGVKKHRCLLAALHGRYINTLIIDEALAIKVLEVENTLYTKP